MKFKKILSVILSYAMVMSTASAVFAEGETYEEKILAADAAALNELLKNPEEGFSVDVSDYSLLTYPEYAAEAIAAMEYTDIAGFETAYNSAMAEMLTTSEIANYDFGANLITNEVRDEAGNLVSGGGNSGHGAYPGLEIRTTQIYNGNNNSGEGFVIFESIEKPAEIVKITAVATANNAGSESNPRPVNATGYSLVMPEYTENKTSGNSSSKNNYVDYPVDSTEFNSWLAYSSGMTSISADLFKFNGTVSNVVDLSVIAEEMKNINSDASPLIIRFSDPTRVCSAQRINGLKLTLTYDNTISLYNADHTGELAFEKVYSVKDDASQLGAAIEALTEDELASLGISLDKYNFLAYPEYVAKEIAANGFETASEFKTAFDAAVEKLLEVVVIENYDLGANLVTNETGYADYGAAPGAEIKTKLVYNGGMGTDYSGYVMYNAIENPSSVVDINAKITEGSNEGTSSNPRTTYIAGYTTVLPQYRENSISSDSSKKDGVLVNNAEYKQGTAEYNEWVSYSELFIPYAPEAFTFAAGSKVSNEIALEDVVSTFSEITTDSTPLVIKFAYSEEQLKSARHQRINKLQLTVTYDNTIALYNKDMAAETAFEMVTEVKEDAEGLDSLLEVITSDEAEALGIDTTVYKKLANSIYVAEAIVAAEWSNAEEFASAFESAVNGFIGTKAYDFNFGAVVSTNESNTSDNYGLYFKSGIIRNGSTSGVTGYVMYDSIADPYAILDIKADITGYNTPTVNNDRNIHITGYTVSDLRKSISDSYIVVNNKEFVYAPGTEIYNTFATYANGFAALEGSDEIIVVFAPEDVNALNKAYKENVDMSVIAEEVKKINKAETALALKFSNATKGNSIDFVELNVTYDLTAVKSFDEGVVAEVNSIIDATGDADVLAIANNYASKLLGDSYSWYKNLANSVRVELFRAIAKEQCADVEAMSAKAIELVSVASDVNLWYEITAVDTENKYVTVKKNTNNTGNFELIVAGYNGNILTSVNVINHLNVVRDENGTYKNYSDLRYAADGETVNVYFGDTDFTGAEKVKVMIFKEINDLSPLAKSFTK